MPSDFGGLATSPNYNALLLQGYQTGREIKKQAAIEDATRAVVSSPGNAEALNALMMLSPEHGHKVRSFQRQEADYQREGQFRNAMSDFGPLGGPPGAPGMPGIVSGYGGGTFDRDGRQVTPPDRQIETAQSVGGESGSPRPANARDAAFLRMWQADPVKAMEIDSAMRDNAAKRIGLMRDAYGLAIQQLGSVGDEASYQTARQGFARTLSSLGIEVPDTIPASYPGPDGIRQLLAGAMQADQQLAALDRRDRLEWDMADDLADNERDDSNTASLISDRSERTQIAALRAQNARRGGGGGARGGSAPPRTMAGVIAPILDKIARGASLTPAEQKALDTYNGRRGSGGGGRGGARVVTVKTVEEARALSPGTLFRTPDGKIKVR